MVEKVHGVLAALSIIAIVSSMFSIVPSIASTVNILQSNTGSLGNSLSLTNSALIKGTFIENVYAQYTDGTTAIIGTNWNYPVSPVIQFAFVQNPANQKTISNFIVTLSFSASSIPSFISSTTVSGNIQVNAAVSGSDGQEHVLVANQNISVPSTSISNGLTRTFYTFLISPSQIAQYNALSGTHQATLKIYSHPSLTFISTIPATTGGTSTTQQSTWSSWVTQFVTLNIGNSVPAPTTTTQTQTQNSGPTVTQPTPVTQAGVTLTSGTLKFFYTLQFQGDPSIYCGVAQPAPNGGCIVNPTSGPLSVALKSLNIVGSNRGTINSLQILNVEPELIPQVSGLNLGTSKIVYTGAISIQGQTIAMPSNTITSDQSSFVDSTGAFRFPTATVNPVTVDQLLKTNNIQPTSATDMTIRIYATGTFTGTDHGTPFQGTLNSPYIDIPVWYIANLPTAPTTATGPAYNPNCNFGVNPDGTCQPYPTTSTCQNGLTGANCQGPPASNSTNPQTNNVPICSNGDVLTLVGTQYYCIVQPNNPPDTPPYTPPSTCQTAGTCQDPPPNPPTTTTPPCPSLDCGTTLPDPNHPPSTGSTNPPVICSGLTCATNFTTNNLPPVNPTSLSLDSTTTIGLVLTVGSIIAIIIVIAIHKKSN